MGDAERERGWMLVRGREVERVDAGERERGERERVDG